jgi:hypothetical protein
VTDSKARSLSPRLLYAVRMVLLLIGVILILVAALLRANSQLSLALFSVGVSIITGTVVSLLSTIFGTDVASQIEDRLNFQIDLYNSGLDRVWLRFSDSSIFEQMTRARTIDLMFNSGKGFTTYQGPRVRDALLHGCRIRVAVADPANLAYAHSDLTDALCPDTDVPQEIRETVAFFNSVVSELQSSSSSGSTLGSVEVRHFRCFPTMTIVIVDQDIAQFTGYLPYVHSAESPVYQVRASSRGDSLLSQYQNAFDRVWNNSTTVVKFQGGKTRAGRSSRTNST